MSVDGTSSIINIEHISQGPKDNRKLTGVSIIEFSSRDVREGLLQKLQGANSIIKTQGFDNLTVARAKTALQKKRNDALHRARDVLSKDARCNSKSVTIEWQISNSKDRAVKVDGVPAFIQKVSDFSGEFLAPFNDVVL